MLETFNAARNDEYEESTAGARSSWPARRERTPGHFTFRELEARGEDLRKLQGFYRKVCGRDLHGARGRDVTDVNPEASGKALGEFAAKVYRVAEA